MLRAMLLALMKPRRSLAYRRSVGSLVIAAIASVCANSHAATERDSPYHVLDQMSRTLVLIENEYVEPVERQRLLEGALKGMVAELDPHSAYLPARDYTVFQGDTEGRFGGIGVEWWFSSSSYSP